MKTCYRLTGLTVELSTKRVIDVVVERWLSRTGWGGGGWEGLGAPPPTGTVLVLSFYVYGVRRGMA